MLIYADLTNSLSNICWASTRRGMHAHNECCLQVKVINQGYYTDASFSRLVDGSPICCCWSWIWSSAWPCAWGWPSSLGGSLSRRYLECVFAVHLVSDHLCPHRPQTDRAPVSLSDTTWLTPLIAPMIQLHSQIALRMTLPLFLSSMTCLLFPRTINRSFIVIRTHS